MACGEKQGRWHAEKKHGHPYLLCHLETIKPDGTRRQIMVNRTLFAIQRKSSPMTRRDKAWSSKPLLLSKDNQVRWHAETKHGHPYPFCYPEIIKADGLRRQNMVIRTFFAIQRQSRSMVRRAKTWSSVPSLPSRDNHVRWRVEKNMVIRTIFAIPRQSSPMVRGDKTWSHVPFFLSRENQMRWHAVA